jgi:hypothetical protein
MVGGRQWYRSLLDAIYSIRRSGRRTSVGSQDCVQESASSISDF